MIAGQGGSPALLFNIAQSEGRKRWSKFRYFAGLLIEETAELIGVAPATVKEDWVMAKAWLASNQGRSHASGKNC
jgi:hypothetical protein